MEADARIRSMQDLSTRPEGYVKKETSLQWLLNIVYRKYPAFRRALADRHLVYNAQTEYVLRRRDEGAVLVIRPEAPLPVQRITKDPAVIQETYDIGKRTAAKQLERIRAFLQGRTGAAENDFPTAEKEVKQCMR